VYSEFKYWLIKYLFIVRVNSSPQFKSTTTQKMTFFRRAISKINECLVNYKILNKLVRNTIFGTHVGLKLMFPLLLILYKYMNYFNETWSHVAVLN